MARTKKKKKGDQLSPYKTRQTRKNYWILPESVTGETLRIVFYLDKQTVEKMKRLAPILIKMEEQEEGQGITKNSPGKVAQYCVRSVITGFDDLIASIKTDEQRTD